MKWPTRLLIVLILSSIAFFYFSYHKKESSGENLPSDKWVVSLFEPVAKSLKTVTDFFSQKINGYFFLKNAFQENIQLKQTLEELRLHNLSLEMQLKLKAQDQNTEQAFAFLHQKLLRARILSFDIFTQSKTILIDRGKEDGLHINDVVVTPEGLAGRIYQVYPQSSKVLLLIDTYFAVDSMNPRTQVRCLLKGLNIDKLEAKRYPFLTQLEFLRSEQEMKVSDKLVTSGLGGIYPEGIPVGTVLTVNSSDENLFEKSLVIPAVDFAKLQGVYVLISPESAVLSPESKLNSRK